MNGAMLLCHSQCFLSHIFMMKKMINITTNNTNWYQNGLSTHIQLHFITPHSFNTINATPSISIIEIEPPDCSFTMNPSNFEYKNTTVRVHRGSIFNVVIYVRPFGHIFALFFQPFKFCLKLGNGLV